MGPVNASKVPFSEVRESDGPRLGRWRMLSQMGHRLLEDAFVTTQIDEAMRDIDAALDPEDRAWLREQLAVLLEEDPELRLALAGARPHQVAQSGAIRRGETDDLAASDDLNAREDKAAGR